MTFICAANSLNLISLNTPYQPHWYSSNSIVLNLTSSGSNQSSALAGYPGDLRANVMRLTMLNEHCAQAVRMLDHSILSVGVQAVYAATSLLSGTSPTSSTSSISTAFLYPVMIAAPTP